MSIISKETWDKFTEEEKKKIITEYNYKATRTGKVEYEILFGKEILSNPKFKIKTWADIEKEHPGHFCRSNAPNPMFIPSAELRDKLLKKTIATYKIATLIELGYGGMVTEEEWIDENLNKYYIEFVEEPSINCSRNDYRQFISFHSRDLAEEFMSYSENVELVKQYYMI